MNLTFFYLFTDITVLQSQHYLAQVKSFNFSTSHYQQAVTLTKTYSPYNDFTTCVVAIKSLSLCYVTMLVNMTEGPDGQHTGPTIQRPGFNFLLYPTIFSCVNISTLVYILNSSLLMTAFIVTYQYLCRVGLKRITDENHPSQDPNQ